MLEVLVELRLTDGIWDGMMELAKTKSFIDALLKYLAPKVDLKVSSVLDDVICSIYRRGTAVDEWNLE